MIEKYNELFKDGKLEFVEFNPSQISPGSRMYLEMWVTSFGIKCWMHKEPINGVYLIKLDHQKVKYLVLDSNDSTHMWGDISFNNIDNNEALSHIAHIRSHVPADEIRKLFDRIDEIANSKEE